MEKNENILNELKITKGIDLIKLIESEPPIKYLWNGIPEGSTGLITGVAKTGKTTFAENLALSMAVGKKSFFEYDMDGIPKRVLFVNLEESYQIKSRRNKKQINILSKNELELFIQNYYSTPIDFPGFLNTDKDWKLLKSYIDVIKPDVIFLDSISRMCVGEIERSSFAQEFIQKFKSYVVRNGMTTIVVHHNTKGNDVPANQNKIAGSRFILQEFDFAYCLESIPSRQGGNYGCMVYNKFIENNSNKAELYSLGANGWISKLGEINKYDLYTPSKIADGRIDNTNAEKVYKYIVNQHNQDNQIISTKNLKEKFVYTENKTMSLDTLHNSMNKLIESGKIIKESNGKYQLNKKSDANL